MHRRNREMRFVVMFGRLCYRRGWWDAKDESRFAIYQRHPHGKYTAYSS